MAVAIIVKNGTIQEVFSDNADERIVIIHQNSGGIKPAIGINVFGWPDTQFDDEKIKEIIGEDKYKEIFGDDEKE